MASGKYDFKVSIGGDVDPSLSASINMANQQLSGLGSTLAKQIASKNFMFSTLGNIASKSINMATDTIKKGLSFSTGLYKNAIKEAMDYEEQLAKIATLIEGPIQGKLKELSAGMLNIMTKEHLPLEDITQAMYLIYSAYADLQKETTSATVALDNLKIAAKAARAANEELPTVINLESQALNILGDTSAQAQLHLENMLFTLIKLGKTSYNDLASGLQNLLPISKALNISFEELFGIFAATTTVFKSASEAGTALEATISGLVKPNTRMKDFLSNIGFDSGMEYINKMGGVINALIDMQERLGGSQEKLISLFGRKEATVFNLTALYAIRDQLKEKIAAMQDVEGALESAHSKITDTTAHKVRNLIQEWHRMKIEIGQEILPAIAQFFVDNEAKIKKSIGRVKDTAIEQFQRVINKIANDPDSFNNAVNTGIRLLEGLISASFRLAGALASVIDKATIAFNAAVKVKNLIASLPLNKSALDYLNQVQSNPSGGYEGIKKVYNKSKNTSKSSGGVMISNIAKNLIKPFVPLFAEGGIVNKPTLALMGEKYKSEVVIPLEKLPALMGEVFKRGENNNNILPTSKSNSGSYNETDKLYALISKILNKNDNSNNILTTNQISEKYIPDTSSKLDRLPDIMSDVINKTANNNDISDETRISEKYPYLISTVEPDNMSNKKGSSEDIKDLIKAIKTLVTSGNSYKDDKTINFSPTININGGSSSKEESVEIATESFNRFRDMYKRMKEEERYLHFSGVIT